MCVCVCVDLFVCFYVYSMSPPGQVRGTEHLFEQVGSVILYIYGTWGISIMAPIGNICMRERSDSFVIAFPD